MFLRRLCLLTAASTVAGQQTGNHPDWPRWCGKVYESGYPSFNPGGQTVEPPRSPDGPFLYVQVTPRYSLYLDSEAQGEFVVRTTLSPYFGLELPSAPSSDGTGVDANRLLNFTISLDSQEDSDSDTTGTNSIKASNVLVRGAVRFNFSGVTTQDTIVPFNLTAASASLGGGPLNTSFAPQNVTLTGWVASPNGSSNVTYVAKSSNLFYLPDNTTGSVSRLDNAYGGFMFRGARGQSTGNTSDSAGFRPYFPYGYYASYDGFLTGATDNASAAATIDPYAAFGLNAMTPLTQYPQSAAAFAYMADHTGLGIQFDLREGYTNQSWVAEQVTAARDNAALFSYWSADEPDGHQDPFQAPVQARDTIRRLDPYHPVAVVLNCQNYYFAEYAAGADVLMEDVYPIGINTTGVSKWGTVCNSTLGDCGCDNCRGGDYGIRDVADRLDDLARYEAWSGPQQGSPWPKTKIHNPQSFHGESYWARDPTPAEAWAMSLVAVNHGAQGLIAWVYPVQANTTAAGSVLPAAHGTLAQVLTRSPVVDFIVGNARPTRLPAATDHPNVDIACWRRGDHLLVSVVNAAYEDYGAAPANSSTPPLTVPIPPSLWPAANRSYTHIEAVVWGGDQLEWSFAGNNLSTQRIPALSTGLIVLSV
ncbi:hypothetical protein SPBR_02505 [Sporothrix brasiliensis 5110]|uniref:Glycoside hydrolase subgroup catalytic core n=1 Tax=Sporothrix brasiliensis 5110 TaxID=1398154 RepID=A0A0C2J1B6_9PEZI|nr:uncharacterized protein SPBR_02505 [Sporothrix brasiliensis 5110]KIH92810.1 hypothetical protein SPBR_02505 [Sporothrix brasiliensis 5110]